MWGYLEDFVVTDRVRGQGVGEKAVQGLRGGGYHHLTWQVLDWRRGVRFYKPWALSWMKWVTETLPRAIATDRFGMKAFKFGGQCEGRKAYATWRRCSALPGR